MEAVLFTSLIVQKHRKVPLSPACGDRVRDDKVGRAISDLVSDHNLGKLSYPKHLKSNDLLLVCTSVRCNLAGYSRLTKRSPSLCRSPLPPHEDLPSTKIHSSI